MNSLVLTCLLAAAPVPKTWKPPIVIEPWACGWVATRGSESWYFTISYTEAEMKAHIEAEDKAKADPLNRKSP